MATPKTTPPTTPVAEPNLADDIVKTPGVCSGQPRIAGTRIKVKVENEEKLVAEMKARAGPSRLAQRLAELNATDDPLPHR